MKMKLLRYLSILSLLVAFSSCEEDDKITDNLPPEDAYLYSFKTVEISDAVDGNGNTFITSGVLTVDPDISKDANEGFSSQVLIQIVNNVDGKEIEITRGSAFSLSGSGTGDAKTFNLNFDEIIEEKGEVNIAANILEAGSGRKIIGSGILVNAETSAEDLLIDYKVKVINWSNGTDANGDGYFSFRTVDFTISTEGDVTKKLQGDVYLYNVKTGDSTLLAQTGEIDVKREGFSDNNTSFTINLNDDLIRSAYELHMAFTEVGGNGEKVFEEIYKAANLVRIGFEPALYDSRVYSLVNEPQLTFKNIDTLGFIDTLYLNFDVIVNNQLSYGNGLNFEIELPIVRVQYFRPNDPTYTEYRNAGTFDVTANPITARNFNLFISDLLPGDAATYDFKIQILEPGENFLNSTEDVVVAEYDKSDYAVLGGIKLDP